MNSSVNPSSNSSDNTAPDQVQTDDQVITPEATSLTVPQATTDEILANRQQPIPPPSEPTQYRAIGLVRGRYSASAEQITRGTLITTDGTELNSVLLGRIMSLVKNHLDLEQEHLWVVYPRIGQLDGNLHLQIVGVWEPEKLSKQPHPALTRPISEGTEDETEDLEPSTLNANPNVESSDPATSAHPSLELEDGYFSIRGEVVYQSTLDKHFVIKIKQAPRKDSEKPKYFKLKLQGVLGTKAVGQFWDLQAKRQADSLVLQQGEAVVTLPSKPKLRKNKPPRKGGYSGSTGVKRNWEPPRPVPKTGSTTSTPQPVRPPSAPKPIKRPKPPQQ